MLKKLLIFLSLFPNFFNFKKPEKTVKYNFSDLSGSIPYKLYLIIQELKELNNKNENNLLLNRLILYGPPGNGKSTLAKKIANEIGADLVEVSAPSVVSPYQGSGAENINKAFTAAKNTHNETKRKIVIFIDEVDAIANNSYKEKRVDNESAVQTLWIHLDKIKNNSNYFLIIATNKFKDLHPTLLDRFGDNIIEIPNPDKNMREEVIRFFDKKFELNLDEKTICNLIKKTNNFSIRAIEDILRSTKRITRIDNIRPLKTILEETIKTHKDKPKFDDEKNKEIKDSKIHTLSMILGTISSAITIPYTIHQWHKSNEQKIENIKPELLVDVKSSSISKSIAIPKRIKKFEKHLCDTFHPEVRKSIINKLNAQFKDNKLLINKFIIHGPDGNGKHTLIEEIAHETGCKIINLELRNLFEPVATNLIDQAFNDILKDQANEKIIISIDIDETSKTNHLISWIDKLNVNQNIIIALVTPRYKFLNPSLVSKFKDIIELQTPNNDQLKELLRFYVKVTNLQDKNLEIIFSDLYANWNYYFNQMSKRDIYSFINEIKAIKDIEGKISIEHMRKLIMIYKSKPKHKDPPNKYIELSKEELLRYAIQFGLKALALI